ncbi:MAG: hypothetical protein KAY32_07040, partial [Candidatus Eisenbacteria sp.]|nr:hypothetical protein [Candidatus Eisenbacteria bacterium]
MRKLFSVLIVLLIGLAGGLAGSPGARPARQCMNAQQFVPWDDRWDLSAVPAGKSRADTVWFGGYNEAEGIAYN